MEILKGAKRVLLPALVAGVAWAVAAQAHAAVHLWSLSQIYSNEDGSVQYIELFTSSGIENVTAGREVRAYRDGERVNTFTFDRNLEGNTQGYLLIATGPIEGVEPDFIIPENFIPIDFETDAAIDISQFSTTSPRVVTYDFIPTDGFRSLDGEGNIRDPATVTNFDGDTAVLGPPEEPPVPEISNVAFQNGSFELSFTAESGHAYRVEFSDSLEEDGWETLETIEGNGETVTVSDTDPGVAKRFYRVTVE